PDTPLFEGTQDLDRLVEGRHGHHVRKRERRALGTEEDPQVERSGRDGQPWDATLGRQEAPVRLRHSDVVGVATAEEDVPDAPIAADGVRVDPRDELRAPPRVLRGAPNDEL